MGTRGTREDLVKRIPSSLFLVSATLIQPSISHATETQIVNCSDGGNFTVVSNVVTQSSNCSGNANIPSGVTSVGSFAFRDATGITSVTIPSGVTSIGAYSFSGLPNIYEVDLPASVESIGIRAFQYSTLVNVNFGEGMKSIGTQAFAGTGTNNLEIPSSLVSMDNPWGAGDIAQLYFWGNAPSGGPGTTRALIWTRSGSTGFNSGAWQSLTKYPTYVVSYDENQSDLGTVPRSSLVANGNPAGLVSSNYGNLSRAGYRFIGWNSSQEGNGIDFAPGDPTLSLTQDTVLYAKWEPTNEVSGDIPCSQGGTFQVTSNRVQNYGDDSMVRSNCRGEAIVPEGVIDLGHHAFYGATSLISIKLPNTLRRIDYSAFSDTGLKSIVIPEGVTHVNPDAFYGLEELQDIHFLGRAPILTYSLYDVFAEDPTSLECTISQKARAIVPNTASGFVLSQSGTWCGLKVVTDLAVREAAAREAAVREAAVREAAAREAAAREAAAREAADTAARTVTTRSNLGAKNLAQRIGIKIVSPKAKVTISVSKASKKVCAKSGAKLRTIKSGICWVTFTVQEPKLKGGKKPKATKATVQLMVQ